VQQMTHLELALVLCCVAVAALFGLACVFDDDGDLCGALCQTESPWCSPDELSCPLLLGDFLRRPAAPAADRGLAVIGLLAAAPGGLCLLL